MDFPVKPDSGYEPILVDVDTTDAAQGFTEPPVAVIVGACSVPQIAASVVECIPVLVVDLTVLRVSHKISVQEDVSCTNPHRSVGRSRFSESGANGELLQVGEVDLIDKGGEALSQGYPYRSGRGLERRLRRGPNFTRAYSSNLFLAMPWLRPHADASLAALFRV